LLFCDNDGNRNLLFLEDLSDEVVRNVDMLDPLIIDGVFGCRYLPDCRSVIMEVGFRNEVPAWSGASQ